MKLFRYYKVYCYGDCADEFLIQANTKDEAIEKLRTVHTGIKTDCLEEIKFENEICKLS